MPSWCYTVIIVILIALFAVAGHIDYTTARDTAPKPIAKPVTRV